MAIRITAAERQAAAFVTLEAAAAAGARCPTGDQGMRSDDVSALARAGQIAVEVSTGNWRRVTILVGAHAGKSTAPNPMRKAQVYLTIDKTGTRQNGRRNITRRGAPAVTLPKLNLPQEETQ